VSSNRPPRGALSNGVTSSDFQLPFELSYEIDAWGRVRKNVEANREQAQASAADLATVKLSVHAQLALMYFQARSLDAQKQLLNSTVEQYEQAFQLNLDRYQGGLASEVVSRPEHNLKQPVPKPRMSGCSAPSTSMRSRH
jgi:outer membrane protein TolC